MKVLAAVCGIMIVLLGVWSTGHNPTDVQSLVEIVCLVGGLVLCFIAVVLARIDGVSRRLDSLLTAVGEDPETQPEPAAPPMPDLAEQDNEPPHPHRDAASPG